MTVNTDPYDEIISELYLCLRALLHRDRIITCIHEETYRGGTLSGKSALDAE